MASKNTKLSGIRLYGRLLSYVLPYIPLFVVSIIGFAVYSGSQVAATEWLKRVIDYVNDPIGDMRLILPLVLIVIALVRGIGFFVGNYLLSSISNRLVHNIRTELFNKPGTSNCISNSAAYTLINIRMLALATID